MIHGLSIHRLHQKASLTATGYSYMLLQPFAKIYNYCKLLAPIQEIESSKLHIISSIANFNIYRRLCSYSQEQCLYHLLVKLVATVDQPRTYNSHQQSWRVALNLLILLNKHSMLIVHRQYLTLEPFGGGKFRG